jgi:putative transposase
VVSLLYLLFRRALAVAGWACGRASSRSSRSWCSATNWLCFAARSLVRGWMSVTASSLLRPASYWAERAGRSSSDRTPCWVGIASLCGDGGRMGYGDRVDPRSRRRSVSSCCGSRVRTRAGAMSGSSVNSPASVSASRQRRSPRSCAKPACFRPALAPSSAGASSCVPTPLDHRLRLFHRRDALARTPLCALLPRTRHAACHFAGCTASPDGHWTAQQARQLAWSLSERATPARFLIHDRDSKFSRAFDEVFQSEGVEIIRTPFRAPKANAFAERWVGTVRRDCLDWLLISSRKQLERVLHIYVDHYNTHRPHRAVGLAAPTPGPRLHVVGPGPPNQLHRRDRLGGLIHEYTRAA